jgi:Ca2+-dependent lipid-binding protein
MSKQGKKESGGILNYFGKKATAVGNWGKKTYSNVEAGLPEWKGVADKVADVSGTIATGAGALAGLAAATGIGNAGVSEALAGVAGVAYGVNKGAESISKGLGKAEEVSGVMRKGIERVRK